MNPYDIDIEKLKESKKIKDEKDILKLKLVVEFLKLIAEMDNKEILRITNLHKSDLSRLKSLNITRFTLDRIVGLFDSLGLFLTIDIKQKKAS
ncbi:MAG: hypothetical protein OXB88_06615 [Bacteriovoracales bacterium]|nr:hypothetical protein [Bacteriovoracales bacterium]